MVFHLLYIFNFVNRFRALYEIDVLKNKLLLLKPQQISFKNCFSMLNPRSPLTLMLTLARFGLLK